MRHPPNLLLISTHDSGRHFGCYGAPGVRTPHLDALAADGVRLSHCFSTSSICSPSRASLLTGLWPQRHGLVGLAGGMWNWQLREPRQHLSWRLRDAGYHCQLVGIQHETSDLTTLGFHQTQELNHDNFSGGGIGVAARAAAFLTSEQARQQPFYLQVGLFESHTAWDRWGCQPEPLDRAWLPSWTQARPDDPALRQKAAALQGSLRRADDAVGMILAALRRAGLEQDTLVLYTTDHGVELPRAKWTLLDPGIGVAAILRWPGGGLTGGRVCPALTSNVDWLPTFCELAGLPTPPDLDGVSFARALRDPSAPPHREELHALFVNGQTYATRTARYKLLRHFAEGYADGPAPAHGPRPLRPVMQLFDLQNDPDELHDLAGDPAHATTLAAMNDRFWRWLEAVDDPILKAPVPTPHFQRAIADAPVQIPY